MNHLGYGSSYFLEFREFRMELFPPGGGQTVIARAAVVIGNAPFRFHPAFFFFKDPAPTEISPLSLHDALPISARSPRPCFARNCGCAAHGTQPESLP